MSSGPKPDVRTCPRCARRGWLLRELGSGLDYHRYDPGRLLDLLELEDEELIEAVSRSADERERILARYAELDPGELRPERGEERICRHDRCYPDVLAAAPGAPRLLHVAGGSERLRDLLDGRTVAIVGSRRATDYGMETARTLARGLTASGVTVVGALAEGIAAAAQMGALEAEGATVTAMPGGLDVCYPASMRELYARVRARGCAVSELPRGCQGPRWSHMARRRVVAGLARLVIVVEAEERMSDLEEARVAAAMGRAVAAVPGRVCSPVSQGTHALLARGAHLVRGAQDALDALYGVGARRAPTREDPPERGLREVLEDVGAGRDTVAKLAAAGRDPREAVVALAELELTGAVVRGDGGRYLRRR